MSENRSRRPPNRAIVEAAEAAENAPQGDAETAAAAAAPRLPAPTAKSPVAYPDVFTLFDAARTAFVHGAGAVADELAATARSEMAAAAEAASAMLGAKTLGDAIGVNAGFARKCLDAMLAGSVRLTEIGTRFAAEASQPLEMAASSRV